MGATPFFTRISGESPDAAFSRAVEAARYEYGHGGYTGTIAEKDSFTFIPVPVGVEPEAFAQRLVDEDDERVSDKWGPAGCLVLRAADIVTPLTRDKARKLAKVKWGPTAELQVTTQVRASKHRARVVTARVTIERQPEPSPFTPSPQAARREVTHLAEGPDASTACGRLLAEPGEYLFFGWASD